MNAAPSSSTHEPLDPERWLADHGDALYAYAMARVRRSAVTEDLVQETFLAAMKARERFSGRSTERTWLIGILKHKIIDYFRKDSRERTYEDTETLEAFEKENFTENGHWRKAPSSWPSHPAKSYERKEFWNILHDCLGELKPAHQQAFTLRELEGRDGTEICDILRVSESNLWVMLYRARMKLRSCLEQKWFTTAPES